jgi:hypothetical protein
LRMAWRSRISTVCGDTPSWRAMSLLVMCWKTRRRQSRSASVNSVTRGLRGLSGPCRVATIEHSDGKAAKSSVATPAPPEFLKFRPLSIAATPCDTRTNLIYVPFPNGKQGKTRVLAATECHNPVNLNHFAGIWQGLLCFGLKPCAQPQRIPFDSESPAESTQGRRASPNMGFSSSARPATMVTYQSLRWGLIG